MTKYPNQEEIIQKYFDFIAKRQMIYHRRYVLKQPFPWTDDKIMQTYKFCNVFRARDRVSVHILDNLRKIDKNDLANIVFNTVIARVFNTGYHFNFNPLYDYKTFNREEFVNSLEEELKSEQLWCRAYTICAIRFNKEAPSTKHIQFSYVFEELKSKIYALANSLYSSDPDNLIPIITSIYGIGEFIGYQIILDLAALDFWNGRITDDNFVVIGPGAIPTTALICESTKLKDNLDCMYSLRDYYQKPCLEKAMQTYGDGLTWEQISDNIGCKYPWLSLSDIEFCCCEFRKYRKYESGKVGRYFKPEGV